ncbi:MAG: YceH family protein [Pseudomonadota bacterium]
MDEFLADFNAVEARVLGSLMEKQLLTPDAYPLTLNALANACNQKNNRDPLMQLESTAVLQSLRQLAEKSWVTAEMSSRVERFKHKLALKLNLDRAQQAILTIIFLRGPQTLNELKVRTERMIEGDEDLLLSGLEKLMNREQPLVAVLPRRSGQREERYTQLLFEQPDRERTGRGAAEIAIRNPDADRIDRLEAEVEMLKAQVAELMVRIGG